MIVDNLVQRSPEPFMKLIQGSLIVFVVGWVGDNQHFIKPAEFNNIGDSTCAILEATEPVNEFETAAMGN